MNRDVMQKWVAALRSGDYTQGTGALRTTHHRGGAFYCCLGVLCELHRQEHSDDEYFGQAWQKGSAAGGCSIDSYGGEVGLPPLPVLRWAGLHKSSPVVPAAGVNEDDEPEGVDIASLNDDYEWTFGSLADAIEKNWEAL